MLKLCAQHSKGLPCSFRAPQQLPAATQHGSSCRVQALAHMLQLELATRHAEGRLLLEELAELLHLLPKGIALAPDLNGLCLLERR